MQKTAHTRAKSNIVKHFVVRNDEHVARRINATPDATTRPLPCRPVDTWSAMAGTGPLRTQISTASCSASISSTTNGLGFLRQYFQTRARIVFVTNRTDQGVCTHSPNQRAPLIKSRSSVPFSGSLSCAIDELATCMSQTVKRTLHTWKLNPMLSCPAVVNSTCFSP